MSIFSSSPPLSSSLSLTLTIIGPLIEEERISAHPNANLDRRRISALLQLDGDHTIGIREGVVYGKSLHSIAMHIKDGLIDLIQIINNRPEEITEQRRYGCRKE